MPSISDTPQFDSVCMTRGRPSQMLPEPSHGCGECTCGSVTLVLLPFKYEIDDSVTVTVTGEAGRCCTLMGGI